MSISSKIGEFISTIESLYPLECICNIPSTRNDGFGTVEVSYEERARMVANIIKAYKEYLKNPNGNSGLDNAGGTGGNSNSGNADLALLCTKQLQLLLKLTEEMDTSRKKILSAFDIMFNSHTMTEGENLNFIILNSNTESYRNVQHYLGEGTFRDDLDYTYTCAHFYRASGAGARAEFLNPYADLISNTYTLVMNYQKMYDDFVPNPLKTYTVTTMSNDGGSSTEQVMVPKFDQFWEIHFNTFKSAIESRTSAFASLGSSFQRLEAIVQQTIDLAETVARIFSVGSTFLDSDERDMEMYSNMENVFTYHGKYFGDYSGLVQVCYDLYIKAKAEGERIYQERVNSKVPQYDEDGWLIEDDSELWLPSAKQLTYKIFHSYILDYVDFWNISVNIHKEIVKFNELYGFNK